MATTSSFELSGEDSSPDSSAGFRQFYERASVDLISYGIACGLSHHDAADIVQNAMLGAYLAWDKLRDLGYERQEAYVVRSIRNGAYDQHRAHGRLAQLLDKIGNRQKTSYVQWDETPGGGEAGTPVLDLLRSLPDQQRQVLGRKAEGWTTPEIAAHLGIRDTTARTHLQKARKKLRELLAAWEASNDEG
ncbi:RNA polymerase sigma factor [Actinoplanes sp. L3-i22]|uniref:RNA polymerase sigma factor n=1 Tax=Actinoplanes sp. L3-i22 TaxID=2836373 RepID=UPI001C74772F|nr:sigma-70 family RNA polymerase sigma factor [Actinoplanes sp. L3-i22]BCY10916.1 hypothetical protein L3i22_060040 [Actinoplanes sp. L3-i22]